jgi:acyl-CoA thioester hydrolase
MDKKLIHRKDFAIRWGDMDAYGHMNNTMYFFYVQEARFELLKEHGIIVDLHGEAPILASTACNFLKPVFYPEIIVVETYLVSIEGKKVTFEHLIYSKADSNKIFASLTALVMWYDFSTNKTILPPESVRLIDMLE